MIRKSIALVDFECPYCTASVKAGSTCYRFFDDVFCSETCARGEGEEAKQEGQHRVTENQQAEWKADVAVIIEQLARRPNGFTGDDVRELASTAGIGEPTHPNAWGAAMSAAAKRGLIQAVGYERSAMPSRHAAVVRVWRAVT